MDIARVREEFEKCGWYLRETSYDEVKELANNTLTGNRVLLSIALQDLKDAWKNNRITDMIYRSMKKMLDWMCKLTLLCIFTSVWLVVTCRISR